MRIIEPSFKIISYPLHACAMLEGAGRTCYKSEDRITDESAEKFCEQILKRGHESVIEHASASVRIVCDRGVSHEIVRHRLASYSQESTRYCNYGKDDHITFIRPCFFPTVPLGEFEDVDDIKEVDLQAWSLTTNRDVLWLRAMEDTELAYNDLLRNGCPPQEARSVLPNSLKTEIVMTANLREWRHFFKLRTAKAAHTQMRELAQPMLDDFKKLAPVIFDDISYDTTTA